MYNHPNLLYCLSQQRQLERERQAENERALRLLRPNLRTQLVQALIRLTKRLEPTSSQPAPNAPCAEN
jgi:hypothetical protein